MKVFIIDKRKRMSRGLWKNLQMREKETNWTRPVLSRSERAGSKLGMGAILGYRRTWDGKPVSWSRPWSLGYGGASVLAWGL